MQNNYKHTLAIKIKDTVMGYYDCWENGIYIGPVVKIIPEEYEKLKEERAQAKQ